MLAVIWNLSLKTELFNSKKYDNTNIRNHPLTVLFINQVDKDILSSYIYNMALNVGYTSRMKQHIFKIID